MQLQEESENSKWIINQLETAGFLRVAIPFGTQVTSVQLGVETYASEYHYRFCSFDFSKDETESAVIGCLSACLNFDGMLNDFAGFLDYYQNNFYQKTLICVTCEEANYDCSKTIELLNRLVIITKDLRSPISVLWLNSPKQLHQCPQMPFLIIKPLKFTFPVISFEDGQESALNTALDCYVGQRVYWEAAGQKDKILQLEDSLRKRVRLTASTGNVDIQLNGVFDKEEIDSENQRIALEYIEMETLADFWKQSLNNTTVSGIEVNMREKLYACGLIWRPTGSLKYRLTPFLVRLLKLINHPFLDYKSASGVSAKLSSVRSCPLISNLVMAITTQVEAELLDVVRNYYYPSCGVNKSFPRELKSLEEDLIRQKDQSRQLQSYVQEYECDQLDLNYATFGQLAMLACANKNTIKFGLTSDSLWKIVNIRNMSAHGNCINWEGMKFCVESVSRLY